MRVTPIGDASRVSQNFMSFGKSIPQHVRTAMEQWILTHVIPRAKIDTPVLTGKLKGALAIINVAVGPNTVSFLVGWGETAKYGRFQERGTRFVAAKRFMVKGIQASATSLPGFWITEVRGSEVGRYVRGGASAFSFPA